MSLSPRKRFHFIRTHWRAVLTWLFAFLFLLGGLFFLWTTTLKIPDLSSIQSRKVEQSLKIYDRTGQVLLYDLNQDIDRTVVPLAQISPYIQQATIAMEDPTFYQNPGVEWTSIVRAFIADITSLGAVQGGSTITQQVVKQTILSGDKTITRKLKEIVLALKLTHTLSKDQILELYLNQAPYGGSMYGSEEASEQFFGVHASEVTLPQAAYLAAILPAPTFYSPYGNNKASLDTLKNIVLDRMYQHGYITAPERDAAKAAVVTFVPQKATAIQAPHFVFYVEQYLEQKYGADALSQSGWQVITTLDADLQTQAETIVKAGALANTTKYNASNAGMIALDPTNGQILVMVGSRNYFDPAIDGNYNVTLAQRQPGSTFKPFAYAEAFEKGYTPDTVLFDAPTQFAAACAPSLTQGDAADSNGCYSPVDFDGKFRGPMTLRDAIAQSINVPSVEVLYLAGISDTLKFAKSLGITTLGDTNQYGLTLVLGGGEVTLLQMTSAYGAFATGGTHYPTTAILEIKDGSGNVVEDDTQPVGTQVMPPDIAGQINDILSDNVARTPEFGTNSPLYFPGHDVADKTGTTNDYRDAWTIGYTPNLVVGAWAGNNDNSPMTKNIAGFIIAPMWSQFMQYAISKRPNATFERTDTSEAGLKPVLRGVWQGGDPTIVDSRTGVPATSATPSQFLQEDVTCNVHNILYWIDKNNPSGGAPRGGSTDPQFPLWEYAAKTWAAQNGCTPGSLIPVGPATPDMLLPPAWETATSS